MQYIIIYTILVQYGIFLSIGKKKERTKIVEEEIDGKITQKVMKYLKNPELLNKDIEGEEEKILEGDQKEILHKNKLNKNVKKVLKKVKKD